MKMPPLALRKTVLDKLTMDFFFLMPSINACRKVMLFLLFIKKNKLINGVGQYFHCHLPLESEPKDQAMFEGEKDFLVKPF